MTTCSNCKNRIPGHVRSCPFCQNDVGFPNIRAADAAEERAALAVRLEAAKVSTRARDCENVLIDFGKAVKGSKAIICRSLSVVQRLISNENEMYISFYRQVDSDARLPEANTWDRGRSAVDSTLFPLYHSEIVFGAVGLGAPANNKYGEYAMILKEEMISNRATVFEENSFVFCHSKHKIVAGDPVPAGYRAVWHERDVLAMAKLHSRLDASTKEAQFPQILWTSKDELTEDFIEVHIFGQIHRAAIERVVGPQPKSHADKVIWKSLSRKLKEIGATLEIR